MRLHDPRRRLALLPSAALALLLLAGTTNAQAIDQVVDIGPDTVGPTRQPVRVQPGVRPVVPQPPRSFFEETPHDNPVVPQGGPGNPMPNDPPGTDVAPGPTPLDTGNFRYFRNRSVKPTGTSTSTVGEPSACINRDTAFMTGNWYAAKSNDSGQTWDYVSPYSFFTAVDGGFCCDQRVEFVRSKNLTIWLLQYGYSGTTRKNTYRLAVARNRDDLRSGNASDWLIYDYDPGDFGYAAGTWLDFPDVGAQGDWFYISSNVFRRNSNGTNSFVSAVRFRVNMADMQNGVGARMSYRVGTSGAGNGSSYRFANAGNGTKMYYASLMSTTSIRIWEQDLASSVTNYVTRTTAAWSTATANVGWLSGSPAMGRLVGGWGKSTEMGFTWSSAQRSGRPMPFSRVARFSAPGRSLIQEKDLWSNTLAWAFPAAEANSSGHVGLVMAVGSDTNNPHSSAIIFDNYQSWNGGFTTYSMASGTHQPSRTRWGDYFDVQRDWRDQRTFVGTGMHMSGGTGNADQNPRFAWFGRDDYAPTWVNVNVRSTPITGVPITVDVSDRLSRKDGTTNFVRSYTPRQGYELTAPATVISGRTTYAFERWTIQVSPTGGVTSQPIGANALLVSDCGNLDDTATAVYKVRRTLTVRSVNPTGGVSISVRPDDINGRGNGATSFTRFYRDSASVSLTAPASVGFNPFRYWRLNGVVQRSGRTLALNITGTRTAEAVYYQNIAGSARNVGAGCVGSNGRVPSHTVAWPGGQQGPQQGTVTSYRLARARALAGGAINFGLSNRTWGAFRLPLDLALIGADGCFFHHDYVLALSMATNSSGGYSLGVTWPVNSSAIGSSIFTSFVVLDPGAPRPTPLTYSNAMETVQGGNR